MNSPNIIYKDITFDWKNPYKFLQKYKILEDFEVEQNMADTIISYLEEKYLDSIEKNSTFRKKYQIELHPNKFEWNLYIYIY